MKTATVPSRGGKLTVTFEPIEEDGSPAGIGEIAEARHEAFGLELPLSPHQVATRISREGLQPLILEAAEDV